MERSSMSFIQRGGAAQKAVTLDLMLRTFMNSPDFQPNNPKMWEGIARLVPGTTPQQCMQRWEDLRNSSRAISRDLSALSARGKPISSQLDLSSTGSNSSRRNLPATFSTNTPNIGERYHFASMSAAELPPIFPSESRPSTARDPTVQQYRASIGRYKMHSGQFTASFCQAHIYGNGSKKRDMTEGEEGGGGGEEYDREQCDDEINGEGDGFDKTESPAGIEMLSRTPSVNRTISSSVSPAIQFNGGGENSQNVMLIHVKDENRKLNKDFQCPRSILIKEMKYFDEYLSAPGANQWEEVDISVHCDVSIFHWLMSYVKRGMREGPSGEPLDTPLESPKLEPSTAVSILISSDFLKMDSLVEECIQYCCKNMSEIVSTPCNMGCIGDHLLVRMAQNFTPLEIEQLKDPKDKIKDKLYMYMLERMFSPAHSQPQCSVNGSTLFRCKHCGCFLTHEQQLVFPCANHRLKVDKNGGLIHRHEGDNFWDINKHVALLRKKGLKWCEVYWRLWGILNWFYCTVCGDPFQCSNIKGCVYHPGNPDTGRMRYTCCDRSIKPFTPLLSIKDGCYVKDHTIQSDNNNSEAHEAVTRVLSLMRETIVDEQATKIPDQPCGSMSPLFRSGEMKNRSTNKAQEPSRNLKHRVLICRPNSTSTIKKTLHEPLSTDETTRTNHKHNPASIDLACTKKRVKVKRRSALEDEETSSSDDPSSSEVEEDEEGGRSITRQKVEVKMSARSSQKKSTQSKKHYGVLRSKSSERSIAEWEWDFSKSIRWNQDMQRDDDEKKLSGIKQKLQQLAIDNENKGHKSRAPDSFSGGIFCRIEHQFRTQRMMSSSSTKHSGHRSFRKGNHSNKF